LHVKRRWCYRSFLTYNSPKGAARNTELRTRFFIIHNVAAGSPPRDRYEAVVRNLRDAEATLEVLETTSSAEGTTAATQAAARGDFDAIVAAGGDGTVHAVSKGVLGSSVPLGIIPTGTADVYAREIGLPRAPAALADTLLHGNVAALPVGEVNGRPFLFVVGVGFDAEAVQLFEAAGSRQFGRMGLVWPAMRALFSDQHRALRVKTSNSDAAAQWAIVTRAKRYAADLLLAPEADVCRTGFYVLRMTGKSFARIGQLSALAVGQLRFAPGVTLEFTEWVSIAGSRGIPVQVDGEVVESLPLEIKSHAKQLRVILPRARTGRPPNTNERSI
jgi:diacylglycerol kinase (ATP)